MSADLDRQLRLLEEELAALRRRYADLDAWSEAQDRRLFLATCAAAAWKRAAKRRRPAHSPFRSLH